MWETCSDNRGFHRSDNIGIDAKLVLPCINLQFPSLFAPYNVPDLVGPLNATKIGNIGILVLGRVCKVQGIQETEFSRGNNATIFLTYLSKWYRN